MDGVNSNVLYLTIFVNSTVLLTAICLIWQLQTTALMMVLWHKSAAVKPAMTLVQLSIVCPQPPNLRESAMGRSPYITKLIMDHDCSETNVVRSSWFFPHLDNETSYFNQILQASPLKFSVKSCMAAGVCQQIHKTKPLAFTSTLLGSFYVRQ